LDTGLPTGRGVRIALIVGAGLTVIGIAGFAVFGLNAWSLMATVVGGPVLVVAAIVRLFEWANTASRLRGVFRAIGWVSLVGGVGQLGVAVFGVINSTMVVQIVFMFVGGLAGLALGLIILRGLRATAHREGKGDEGRNGPPRPS
jgi:uncharacterized integral membrane protein